MNFWQLSIWTFEIMRSAFIGKIEVFENALREEVELLEQFFLNFTLFFTCCSLPITPQPLTRIEQMIYRWKAAINTQLSRVDRFFILATILKVFQLKFIHYNSQTSCCFHVELLWHILVCNFLIHSSVLHKWYSFCRNLSHKNFWTFSGRALELRSMKF